MDSPETAQYDPRHAMEVEAKIASTIDHRPDLKKTLTRSKLNAQEEIKRCDRLLALLEANPDVTEILQLLGKGGLY